MLIILADGFEYLWERRSPEESAIQGILILIVIAAFIIAMALVSKYYKYSESRKARWAMILKLLLRQKLDNQEISIVQIFFKSLDNTTADEIIMDNKIFRSRLREFLVGHPEFPVRKEVLIINKLFPEAGRDVEPLSAKDLMTGEICSLESLGQHNLAAIVKIDPPNIFLSLSELLSPLEIGAPAGLFVFRPMLGGFLFKGSIRYTDQRIAVFSHSGAVEAFGDQHLMANLEYAIELNPWPSLSERQLLLKLPLPQDAVETEDINLQILGTTRKISDRALSFTPDQMNVVRSGNSISYEASAMEKEIQLLLLEHELWEVKMALPDGFIFKSRVKLRQSLHRNSPYILKFLDASENSRLILFTEIKKNNPAREMMT